MNIQTLKLILITQLLFIGSSLGQNDIEYFEGQIIYDIEYSPYDNSFESENLKELMGSKMILTFKDGDYKKEYFSPSGKKLRDVKLILKDKKMYSKRFDSDTISWVDITENDTKITFEKLADSIVEGYSCRVLDTEITVRWNNEYYLVEGLYIYAQELPINPAWYSDFNEANYNEIMNIAKGIAIIEVEGGLFWEQKLEMSSIVHRKVKNSEIRMKLNKNTPLIKL